VKTDEVSTYRGRADRRADSREALFGDLSDIWTRLDQRRKHLGVELDLYLSDQLVELVVFHISRGATTDMFRLLDGQGALQHGFRADWAALLGSSLLTRLDTHDLGLRLLAATALSPEEPLLRQQYCDQLGEHMLLTRDFDGVQKILNSEMSKAMSEDTISSLRMGLVNPFVGSPSGDNDKWASALHKRLASEGIGGVTVRSGVGSPFLRLEGDEQQGSGGTALVTIVMVADADALDSFDNGLRSLQNQTWSALEILVVDTTTDGSFAERVQHVGSTDERVRYLRADDGVASLGLLDGAIEVSAGEYLTWQSGSEWSHPERIACQLTALSSAPDVLLVDTAVWTVTDQLLPSATRAEMHSKSAWMARTSDVQSAGGVLRGVTFPIHELGERLCAINGSSRHELDRALVVRLGDAATMAPCVPDIDGIADAEWHSFVQSWHRRLGNDQRALRDLDGTVRRLNENPQSGESSSNRDSHLDVLMVGDWHSFGGPQLSMLAEIKAFRRVGKSVGVMHVQPPRFFGSRKDDLCEPIVDLILSGDVSLVTPVDPIHVSVTVVRYPPILAFGPVPTNCTQDTLIVLANQAPSERDGSDVRYRVEDVRRNIEASFGSGARWAPQGPQVRSTLLGRVPPSELLDIDLPGVIDTEVWGVERQRLRGPIPVIGRHSRDTAMKWPSDADQLLEIYPDDPEFDVRIMGGAASAQQVLGRDLPPNWLVYRRDQLPVRTFLSSLDFFVYYQHPEAFDAFGRAVLEALAVGCVVILPPHMRPVFGDAAIYAEPEDVRVVIRDLYSAPSHFFEQSLRAINAVEERYSLRAHSERIDLISQGIVTAGATPTQSISSVVGAPPRGFIWSDHPVEVPAGYQRVPGVERLFVDPRTLLSSAATLDGDFVVVIGTCVPIENDSPTNAAERLLAELQRGDEDFLRALASYSGRHAVLFMWKGQMRVVTDATGMRTVFFADSGGVFASHASLVERAVGGTMIKGDLPFNYGFPGNQTPYAHTRIVTPNTALDVATASLQRFWPREAIEPRELDDVAEFILDSASESIKHVAREREIRLALTAGLDSRTLLAVAIHSGVDFEAYTYDNGDKTLIDNNVARDLAQLVGVRHTRLAMRTPSAQLAEELADAHYSLHHARAVEPLREWFGESPAVAVTANLLEIGRSFYKPYRADLAPPTTPEGMRALHGRSMHSHRDGYSKRDVQLVARQAFADWIRDAQVAATFGRLNPFDQFYWEHRMASWHGPAMVERDFYAEPFIPFNSRRIFEAMLGLTQEHRDSGAVFTRIIQLVDLDLLSIPINPKAWPLQRE
jgi:hypothetical protein